MALMDPYGLTLFPVEVWGVVLGVTATGFIIGGGLVAKFGLGANPIRTMLILVACTGVVGGNCLRCANGAGSSSWASGCS